MWVIDRLNINKEVLSDSKGAAVQKVSIVCIHSTSPSVARRLGRISSPWFSVTSVTAFSCG